jgi:MFS transporter, Spinster family, sphingosine-1-phosphate transporter
VGSALAYYFGGKIGLAWGWRWAFLLAGIPGLILAFLVLTLPKQPVTSPESTNSSLQENLTKAVSVVRQLWQIPPFRRVTLGYGLLTFAIGGLAFWMPRFLEVQKGLNIKEANVLMALATVISGGLGTLAGGWAGDLLFRFNRQAHLWVSGLGVLLSLPFAALAIYATVPFYYKLGLFISVFLLFLNPGVLTTVIVSIAGTTRRASAIALNIIIIHLVGDVPSPFLMGWLSDKAGLQWGVSLALVALGGSAVLLLSGIPVIAQDLERGSAGEQ